MIAAQDAAAAVEGVLLKVARILKPAQLAEVGGEAAGGRQCVRVIVPEDPPTAGEGVVVQFLGTSGIAEFAQDGCQVAGRAECVRGQCCVGPSVRAPGDGHAVVRPSDGDRELVEGLAEPVAVGYVGGDLVVAAAEVLDEGVPGGDDPRGPVALESAHRPEPGLQPPVIGLDRIIGPALDGVQRRGNQLVKDPRIGGGAVSGDFDRDRARAQRPGEEPPGGQVAPRSVPGVPVSLGDHVYQDRVQRYFVVVGRPCSAGGGRTIFVKATTTR